MNNETSPSRNPTAGSQSAAATLEDLARIAPAAAAQMTEAMFAACDDYFFDLASRARSNQEQSAYFDALREIRARKPQSIDSFTQLLAERVKDFATAKPAKPVAAHRGNLSLVAEEQVEREAVTTDMISRARNEWADALYQLNERLHVIAPHLVDPTDNPFDPAALTLCFVLATDPVDVKIDVRKTLYRQFERHVLAALDEFYFLLNQRLVEAGILPELSPLSPRKIRKFDLPEPKKTTPAAEQKTDPAGKSAALGSARAAASGGQGGAGSSGDAGIPDSAPETRELANVLRKLRDAGVRLPLFAGAPSDGSPPIEREELLGLLSDVARKNAETEGDAQPLDIRQSIESIIASRGQLNVSQADEDIINVIAMFFDNILDDQNLPLEIQALVSRLQLPVLKVALRDRTFFTDRKHPARQLINEIARTSIGWDSSSEDMQEALYIRITELVEEVLRNFPDQTGIFDKCLKDLTRFIERSEARTTKVERRTTEKAQADARTTLARNAARQVLQQRMLDKLMPASVASFLVEDWQQVLHLIFLRSGAESAEWLDAVQVVDDLIGSMEPPADSRARNRLEQRVPELLQRLESGLANTQSSADEASVRVDGIRAIYARMLGEVTPEEAEAEAAADPVTSLSASQLEQITPAEQDEKAWRDMTAVERQKVQYETLMFEFLRRVDEFPTGTWFEYDDLRLGVTRRCKLSTRIAANQNCIFVNRVGLQVFEKPREAFAYDLQMGHARPLADAPLFDRTIDRITGNLRKLAGDDQE